MAGTIFGLPLSQQWDANGDPLSGALLYIYAAGTSTPSTPYEDFALGTAITWPIEADSAGRIPQFWLADGDYRVRLTDAAGNEIFDLNSVTALGASSSSGGGGGGSSVSDSQIFTTGDLLWQPISGARSGWVRANGRTIGSSSSGATERANADCQALFEFLWAAYSGALTVAPSRGATATADWDANKTIVTLDMRGRTCYGLDDMGNSAGSVIAAATVEGGALGQESKAILQANLPNVNFSASSLTATPSLSVGTSISNGTTVVRTGATYTAQNGSGATHSNVPETATNATLSLASGTVSGTVAIGGSVPSGGSDVALATLSPGRAGTWYIKL